MGTPLACLFVWSSQHESLKRSNQEQLDVLRKLIEREKPERKDIIVIGEVDF